MCIGVLGVGFDGSGGGDRGALCRYHSRRAGAVSARLYGRPIPQETNKTNTLNSACPKTIEKPKTPKAAKTAEKVEKKKLSVEEKQIQQIAKATGMSLDDAKAYIAEQRAKIAEKAETRVN